MADVRVDVDLNTAPAEQEAKNLKQKMAGTFGDMGKIAGGIFMAGIASGLADKGVQTFRNSITLARDYNEILSKSNTIFGEQAGAIEKWASAASTGFGQSKAQALDAAASFGNMFTQLGMTDQEASKMSTTMTELASDFASFHNADITEVLNAQQAAFRGEYDAVQRFVPTINAAAVELEALAQTGKTSNKELTAGEKAAAAYSLMLKGAGDAAGDFERTSGSLSNQQRILSAQWADFQTSMGQVLIPALTAVAIAINTKVIPAVKEFSEGVKKAWDSDIKPAIDNIVAGWQKIDQVVLPIITVLIENFGRMAKAFALSVGIILDLISGDWNGAWEKAKEIVHLAVRSVEETLGALKDIAIKAILAFRDGIVETWNTWVLPFFKRLPSAIIEAIGDVASYLFNKGKELIQGFVKGMLSVPIPNPLDLLPGGDFGKSQNPYAPESTTQNLAGGGGGGGGPTGAYGTGLLWDAASQTHYMPGTNPGLIPQGHTGFLPAMPIINIENLYAQDEAAARDAAGTIGFALASSGLAVAT